MPKSHSRHKSKKKKSRAPDRSQTNSSPQFEAFDLSRLKQVAETNSSSEISVSEKSPSIPETPVARSLIESKGLQNGIPWSKSSPNDKVAFLRQEIVNPLSQLDGQRRYVPMDDVKLLERGIVDKTGNRRQENATGTCEMNVGRMAKLSKCKKGKDKQVQAVTVNSQKSNDKVPFLRQEIVNPLDGQRRYVPMDDLELLEHGIVDKTGSRRQDNATETCEMNVGSMAKLSKRMKRKDKQVQAVTVKSQSCVTPCNSLNDADYAKAISGSMPKVNSRTSASIEQLHRSLRSLSPISQISKTRMNETMGTVLCKVGRKPDVASFDYTISSDSRTYTINDIKGRNESRAHWITLEIGSQRSFLELNTSVAIPDDVISEE